MAYYNENGSVNVTFAPTSGFVGVTAPDGSMYVTPQNLVTTGFWHIPTGGTSGAAVPVTGTTSETTLGSVVIPAGAMGANGIIRVTALFSYTSSGNNKTLRVRLGGLAGTAFHQAISTTSSFHQTMVMIRNRNSVSSQVSAPLISAIAFNTGSAAVGTGSVNTANEQTLVITGQLANNSETITLEAFSVEILKQS